MALKYRPGATDADGRYYLTATAGNVLGHRTYNTESGAWGNPIVFNFMGAARDGYWYANGVLAEWGDFGDVAGGVRHKSWSTIDPAGTIMGFPKNFKVYGSSYAYDANRNPVSMVGTNRARLNSPNQGIDKTTNCLTTAFRGCLVGNFDVEMPLYTLGGQSSFVTTAVGLIVFGDQVAHFSAGAMRTWNGTAYTTFLYEDELGDGTSYGGSGGVWTPTASAKLAVTRVGNVYRAYYDAGGGGGRVQIGTRTAIRRLQIPRLHVGVVHSQAWARPIQASSGANAAPYAEVGINLVSGTFLNRPSWSAKTSTVDRGARADFPENILLVWTAKELALIDLDNEKLWMRFKNPQAVTVAGQCHILPGQAATTSIVDAWLDVERGLLLVTLYDSVAATKGIAIAADFANDLVDCFHNSTTTFSIGDSFEMGQNPYYPWEQRSCQFDYPNAGSPGSNWPRWAGGSNWRSWQTQGDQYRVVATWTDATYLYKAIATRTGLRIIRHQIEMTNAPGTYATWSGATDILSVKFSVDGELVFADTTNVYVTHLATWQGAFGGTFSADVTIAQPGSLSLNQQYNITTIGIEIYLARDEGIYVASVYGPTFDLIYGDSGSAASYKILQTCDRISCVGKRSYGGTDYLVCATRTAAGPVHYIHVISPSSCSEFWGGDVSSDFTTELITIE